jgi:flavin reductase (DIM6/NTAB) family NADH-FMN oxidoreductase RutF
MAIGPSEFKHILSRWGSGVTVVTMKHGETVHGMTASAFCSVSLEPPLILICVGKKQGSLPLIKGSGRFVVNILAEGQEQLSDFFAKPRPEGDAQFAAHSHQKAANGTPILDGSMGWMDCKVHSVAEGGDHDILIGLIEKMGVSETAKEPLVYFCGKYRKLEK